MPNLISKLAGEKNMIQTLILPKAKGTSESLSDTKRGQTVKSTQPTSHSQPENQGMTGNHTRKPHSLMPRDWGPLLRKKSHALLVVKTPLELPFQETLPSRKRKLSRTRLLKIPNGLCINGISKKKRLDLY